MIEISDNATACRVARRSGTLWNLSMERLTGVVPIENEAYPGRTELGKNPRRCSPAATYL